MLRRCATSFALVFIALTLPAQLRAQAPGGWMPSSRSIRAEYYAEVLNHVNAIAADWATAWSNDNVDDLYADNAVVIPEEGASLRTREEIRSYFEEYVKTTGHVESFMLDFDASGEIAMVYGNWRARMTSGPDAGQEVRGPMVTRSTCSRAGHGSSAPKCSGEGDSPTDSLYSHPRLVYPLRLSILRPVGPMDALPRLRAGRICRQNPREDARKDSSPAYGPEETGPLSRGRGR